MNLQAAYDLDSMQRASAGRIAREVHPRGALSHELGRRAALEGIECVDRISLDRFGRKEEIRAAQARLVGSLRKRMS